MKTMVKMSVMLFVFLTIITACKKDEENSKIENEEFQNTSSDNAFIENESENIDAMSFEASQGKQKFISYNSDCVSILKDSSEFQKTVTIDFGPTNCLCNDGRYRRGKIIISIVGDGYFSEGTIITKTTENYFVNDNQIVGTKKVTNNGNYTHQISANWTIIKANGEGTVTWNSERTKIQTTGMDTPDFKNDDTYSISGNASGVNAKGKNYSLNIVQNLIKDLACKWIKSGIINISVGDKNGSINFGDGTCDNQAIVSKNGNTKVITLK